MATAIAFFYLGRERPHVPLPEVTGGVTPGLEGFVESELFITQVAMVRRVDSCAIVVAPRDY